MSTENKFKHLILEQRLDLEEFLRLGMTFKAAGKKLGKDPTTLAKEVQKHIQIAPPAGVLAGTKPPLCSKLLKAPYVCNGCNKRTFCRLEKHIYNARLAQEAYQKTLVDSRQGVPLTKEAFYRADELLTEGVRHGQHIYHITQTHNLGMSVSTVYRNISKGYLSVSKLDLPRAPKFKPRKSHQEEYVPPMLKKGRTYDDFLAYIDQNDISCWLEMDTVIGTPGGKVIMTFDFTDCNFMFGLLLDNKTALEAASKITAFKSLLVQNGFSFAEFFPLILTDNGGEFSNVHAFEDDAQGNQESHLFFCDPYRSSQKPKVEKNHTLFRDIVPKGTSFDSFSQDDVNLIFSHVNSIKRKKLHKKSPFEVFVLLYEHLQAQRFTSLLGISSIPPEEVIQSPRLLKQLKSAHHS